MLIDGRRAGREELGGCPGGRGGGCSAPWGSVPSACVRVSPGRRDGSGKAKGRSEGGQMVQGEGKPLLPSKINS